MKTPLILNDAPCGSERTCNGARPAGTLGEPTPWTAWADKALVF